MFARRQGSTTNSGESLTQLLTVASPRINALATVKLTTCGYHKDAVTFTISPAVSAAKVIVERPVLTPTATPVPVIVQMETPIAEPTDPAVESTRDATVTELSPELERHLKRLSPLPLHRLTEC